MPHTAQGLIQRRITWESVLHGGIEKARDEKVIAHFMALKNY